MNTSLTVEDPLTEQEVTIHITLPVGKQARNERPALLSVGIAGQPPITKHGTFAQILELIDQAWAAFGVQAQLATAQSDKQGKEAMDAPSETAVVPEKEAKSQPNAAQSKPQPDLSILF